MTSLRRFAAHDLLQFNNVNLDYFTETVSGLATFAVTWAQVEQRHRRAGRRPALQPLRIPRSI